MTVTSARKYLVYLYSAMSLKNLLSSFMSSGHGAQSFLVDVLICVRLID